MAMEGVIAEIDAQIAKLEQARTLLAGTSVAPKKRGRPAGSSAKGSAIAKNTSPKKKRKMSAEGRARIAAAQKARWAKLKRTKS